MVMVARRVTLHLAIHHLYSKFPHCKHELGIVLTSWVMQCRQNEAGLPTVFLLRNRAPVCQWECLTYQSSLSKCITHYLILS